MGSTLTVDNIVGATTAGTVKMPAGHVIQTVQFTRLGVHGSASPSGNVSANSSTFVDIMSKAITTKVANSKILVTMRCIALVSGGNGSTRGESKVFRNATLIGGDTYAWYGANDTMLNHSVSFLDAPSVGAGTALTYKLQGNSGTGTMIYMYSDSGGASFNDITLMEIAQ